ncbi:MAG: hypothetical protein HY247_05425 [archaeon]|nr:MAG: hypothetical protein HY247_05425 [archaeon]
MKTTTIAASALVVLLVAGLGAVALANSGHQNEAPEHGPDGPHGPHGPNSHSLACWRLTANETLTVTFPQGHYVNAANASVKGNASGVFDFKVSQIYARGCTLSLTGGSFKLGTTTYNITGGSVILNHGGRSGIGTGTTSGGTFLIRVAGLQGNSTSADVGAIRLDFKNGSSEFFVQLSSPDTD